MKLLLILISAISILNATENNLGCDNVIKFSDFKGTTFLTFMKDTTKPTLDSFVIDGYALASAEQVKNALDNVSPKVKRSAIRAAGSEENLLRIAKELEYSFTNLHELPSLIASVDSSVNRYKLSTFFGLASCAGAIIEFAPGHIAYNIHYGTGEIDTDDRTGRSFGEGVVRDADDASDKNYLIDLEEFGHDHASSMENFYRAMIKSLANNDSSDMLKTSDFSKLLLTDFLAVFTAEQARNLMDNKVTTHWDAALLEVTMLGAFHSGQSEFKLFYKNPVSGEIEFTNRVFNQTTGCSEEVGYERTARMYDYWQFSTSSNPSHCKRSGINITKKSFRKLGEKITKFQMENNPELVDRLTQYIGKSSSYRFNIFNQVSKFFISDYAEKALNDSDELAEAFVAFIVQVKKDADKITALIENGEL